MKNLKDIVYKVAVEAVFGTTDLTINTVAFDSRKVNQHTLFVAQKGLHVDGHDYIDKAIFLGAVAVICETLPKKKQTNITYLQVKDSNEALAIVASNFYDNPSNKINLIGITGTNGKTTVATLLFELFQKLGYSVGLLSTVNIRINDKTFSTLHTTPDSLKINQYLSKMIAAGVAYCFMEVSSHGIHQKRTAGLHFRGGVFTNLTHDHLDYHKTFKEYRDIKKQFFDALPKAAFSLVNSDDKNGLFMLQNTKAKQFTYALKSYADFNIKILENQFSGMLLHVNTKEVWVKLIGRFNAYNVGAVFAVAILLEQNELEVLQKISELNSVSGRFQYLISEENITAIVDYAHTPDALKNVLETINDIRTGNEDVITVVGCGGDRDKSKRPIMAHIASQLSNQAIFTSDNPRTENPQTIIEEMEAGVAPQNYRKTLSILDREQAIKTAVKMAQTGDIILIAGKGHETYQEINGVRTDFDDYKKVNQLLIKLKDAH